MRDELPDWMDAPSEDGPAPNRRLRRLLVLAAVPWVVVAGLVFWASGDGSSSPDHTPVADSGTPPSDPAGTPDAPGDAADPAPSADGDVPDGSPSDEHALDEELLALALQGGWRAEPGDGATVAVAVAVARAFLTGVGPTLTIDGIEAAHPDGYAEHLTVEALERPGPGAAVVTISAVVLHAGEEQQVRQHRLAVPVDETGGDPRPAGRPWPLPARQPAQATPTPTAEVDREHWPAAERALAAAGFGDAELRGLQHTDGWPVLASVRTGQGDHVVWLRRHLHDFVVAGLPLSEGLDDDRGAADDTGPSGGEDPADDAPDDDLDGDPAGDGTTDDGNAAPSDDDTAATPAGESSP